MSITYPIFPGLAPAQSYVLPKLPIRSPKWNFKETAKWNNERQQAVNGRLIVIKYWNNPLWSWEWAYGYVKDRPTDSNPFYTVPIPATDFEVLKGFFNGMQAGGNEFAYQPPDSVRGGNFTITAVQAPVNGVAILTSSTPQFFTQIRLGDNAACFGFSVATWLNGKVGTVIAFNQSAATITLAVTTGGTHALVSDTGTAKCGQSLSAPDANGNVEIVQTVGSYPNTISSSPVTTLVTESVQLMDTSLLTIFDATGTSLSSHFTLANPNTVSPYAGYVAQFGSYSPTLPISAGMTYYYLSRFSEDTQEYENFMSQLWLCSSVKFEQERI
jgi:hypothetical protein